jgi:hypothetical protein
MRRFVEHYDFVIVWQSNIAFSFQDFDANYERNNCNIIRNTYLYKFLQRTKLII